MLDLLIVDDEAASRNGLINFMPWSELGVRVCGEAINGKKALEQVSALCPDIVLTDIRMPFMDGVELCCRLREAGDTVKVIFISGYEDLDYYRSAIQYGVSGYVLKPVDPAELSVVVRQVVEEVLERRIEIERIEKMEAKLLHSLPLLHNQFLIDYIHGRIDVEEFVPRLAELGLNLSLEGHYVFVLLKPTSGDLMNELVTAIAQRSLPEYTFRIGTKECAVLWRCDTHDPAFAAWLDTLRVMFGMGVLIGIGQTLEGLTHIPQAYAQACEALACEERESQSARKRLIGQIQTLVCTDLRTNLTIRDIADAVHYSATHITTLFKQETGQTINEFVTCCRMKKARLLLDTTNLRAYEIADKVGYRDSRYFARLYCKHFGITPSCDRGKY